MFSFCVICGKRGSIYGTREGNVALCPDCANDGVEITKKEDEILRSIYNCKYHEDQSPINNYVWVWACNPTEEFGEFLDTVAVLRDKKLVRTNGSGENSVVAITQRGFNSLGD